MPFAPETPPAREALAESRTLRGIGAAVLATVGAEGVEVAQEVMAEAQEVFLVVFYLDSLRWLFIAPALAGIAVNVWARLDNWRKEEAVMNAAMLAGLIGRPWSRQVIEVALAVLTVALFLFNLRRSGEHAGRAAERLRARKKSDAIYRKMLDAAARRPHHRDALVQLLPTGES